MRIEKVKQTLRKVNALIDNLDSQGSTSAIERDLLKRYLTDLYEEVALSSSNVIVEEPSVPDAPATVQSVEPSPVQQPNIVTPQENQPVAPLDQQTTYYDADAQTTNGDTDEAPVADASINQFSDSSKYFPPEQVEEVVPTAPEPVKLQESISPQETAPVPTPTPEMETEVEVAVDESRFEAVFHIPEGADLAAKYASGRIEKIDSAMGINQRLLIVNELFGGDMQAFNNAVAKLNDIDSFSEASAFLINGPASSFAWDKADKTTIARDFVQIVRRKYH